MTNRRFVNLLLLTLLILILLTALVTLPAFAADAPSPSETGTIEGEGLPIRPGFLQVKPKDATDIHLALSKNMKNTVMRRDFKVGDRSEAFVAPEEVV